MESVSVSTLKYLSEVKQYMQGYMDIFYYFYSRKI